MALKSQEWLKGEQVTKSGHTENNIIMFRLVFLLSGVDFMSGGQPLSLVVLLPPEFPKDRPTMYVEPRDVHHPWIRDDGAVVGAPGKIHPRVAGLPMGCY